jgi:hypothetical protein
VREEGDRLILGAGIPPRWIEQDAPIRFGPAPTSFGTVSLSITSRTGSPPRVEWQGDWHRLAPPVEICLPGFEPVTSTDGTGSIDLVGKES